MPRICPRCREEWGEHVEMELVPDPNYPPISGIKMWVCPECEYVLRSSTPITGRYDIEENGDMF